MPGWLNTTAKKPSESSGGRSTLIGYGSSPHGISWRRIELIGDLTFDTVSEFFARSSDVDYGSGTTVLDLSQVTRTDSAGLALMVEWLRGARRKDGRIEVINMPEQMRSIARMCKLDGVLLAEGG